MNVCQRNECQTTAGCAYRGPHGEFCYFAGDFGLRTAPTPMSKADSVVKLALVAAREKLALYYAKAGPEYVGGMEYSALVHFIDRVLLSLRPDAEEGGRDAQAIYVKLGQIYELFSAIKGDFTDPRSQCREGWKAVDELQALITVALSAPPLPAAGEHERLVTRLIKLVESTDGWDWNDAAFDAGVTADDLISHIETELTELRTAPRSPADADMRAFGASDAACYKWPDDTPEHRACRAAYIEGAAESQPTDARRVALEKLRPHKIMTEEEYQVLKLIGWHSVCRNVDSAGNVGIRFGGLPE